MEGRKMKAQNRDRTIPKGRFSKEDWDVIWKVMKKYIFVTTVLIDPARCLTVSVVRAPQVYNTYFPYQNAV